MIGRTHGVHAEPMTFGVKLALWYAELARDRRARCARARSSPSARFRGRRHVRASRSVDRGGCLQELG
jgi:adenylosuccinate lyase